jgi:hypothetical protein
MLRYKQTACRVSYSPCTPFRCICCPVSLTRTCNWATAAAVSCSRATDTGCVAVWAGSGGWDSLRHRCDVTVTVGAECSSTSWWWYCNWTCCVISRIRSGYSCDSSERTWNSTLHLVYFTLCAHWMLVSKWIKTRANFHTEQTLKK